MPHGPVVIVDPYSSGAMLATALCEHNVPCVAVQSNPHMPRDMRTYFEPERFVEVIMHDADFEATLTAVAVHQPSHVIAGFDSGVELAERLAHALHLPTNGKCPDAKRWHKFHMIDCVAQAGLPAPRQHLAATPSEAAEIAAALGAWPVIVKPVRSVASDRVSCCHAPQEASEAAQLILQHPNVLGRTNEAIVVQEYLQGTEYIVDTVSYAGQRKVTAIWQYGRRPHTTSLGYDRMELIPYDGDRQRCLKSYVFDCLDALEINFGPAHCEVMWIADQPVLIEVGARMSAGINAILSRLCGGICQLDETVAMLLEPDRFLATLDRPVQLARCGMNIFLSPSRPGRLVRTHGLEQIEQLPTVHSVSAVRTAGQTLGRVAGRVTLIAEDRVAMDRDLERIEQLESAGIFEVADE